MNKIIIFLISTFYIPSIFASSGPACAAGAGQGNRSAARANDPVDVKMGLEDTPTVKSQVVTLKSEIDRGLRIPIDRKLIKERSSVLKSMLENEPEASEITLPKSIYLPAAQFLMESLQHGFALAQKAYPIVLRDSINQIYKTADFLNIDPKDPLFKSLASAYADKLHANRKAAIAQITELGFSPEYLVQIAREYFLKYPQDPESENMDTLLGVKVTYTLQELIDNGMISSFILNRFPDLKKNLNQSWLDPQELYYETLLTMAIRQDDLKTIKTLLKLGVDVNHQLPDHLPVHYEIRKSFGLISSALSVAIQYSRRDAAALLLRQGAYLSSIPYEQIMKLREWGLIK